MFDHLRLDLSKKNPEIKIARSIHAIKRTTSQKWGAAMWGYSLSFWQSVVLWTMWIGFVLTALGAAAAVISSFVSYHASNASQADADARIDGAAAVARQAASDVAAANEVAAKANERAATLERDATALRAQAEADRLARVKLEQKLAPRALSGEQQKEIAAAIASFAPQKFQFVMYQDDAEVSGLARAMLPVLLTAGWVGVPQQGFLAMQLEIGVRVEFSPDKEAEFAGAASALSNALNAAGVAATWGARDKLESSDDIKIRVGKKP